MSSTEQSKGESGEPLPPNPPPPTETPPPPPALALAPLLAEELTRTTPVRRSEDPHLTNLDAVSTSSPTDVLFYNNLEKVFVKNSGQFPRVVLDLPFLLQGQDGRMVETVMGNPKDWLPVVPALSGRYLFSKVPEVVDLLAESLREAGGPELLVLRSEVTTSSNPSRGRRGNRRMGRGGRGISGTSHAPRESTRGHFAPPFAAFLEAPSLEIGQRYLRQRTFSKSKIITCLVVPTIDEIRHWTVGQFWTTVEKYDDVARASLFAIKAHLFNDQTFRNEVQTISAVTGDLDDQVLAFLDTFDLHLQDYEYREGKMSQR